MRVALVSDVHLGGPDDADQEHFLRWVRALRADHLVLLGDVFDTWWHWGAEPFPAYAPVVAALRALPTSLLVLPGNHDFRAPRFFHGPTAPISPAASHDGVWDGLRVHLAHGDHVDTSPGYRALTALLRGPVFGAAVDAMGPTRAWSFLRRLSGPGGGTPSAALVAAQEGDARRRLAGGADLVVFGHTHAPCLLRVDGGGAYLNLGDWVTHHTWGRVEDGRVFLENA